MNSSIKDRISVKIFVGFPLSSELKMHLNQSSKWKQDEDFASLFKEVHHQGKTYFGNYLESHLITLHDLQVRELEMRKTMAHFFPELKAEKLKIQIFSQLFIL